jgi:flagellar protein FliO/FliZ
MMMNRKAGVRLAWICCLFVLLFASLPTASFAEDRSAWDAIVNGGAPGAQTQTGGAGPAAAIPGNTSASVWGYLLQVIFSLGVIVVCITFLVRFLAKRQLSVSSGPIRIVGTAALGNGKTLQLVMIGDSLYVLGVGENVQLLRHLPPGEEVDVVLAEAEIKPEAGFPWDKLPFLRKKHREEELMDTTDPQGGSFEELLRRQWGEVNGRFGKSSSWREEDEQRRGDQL